MMDKSNVVGGPFEVNMCLIESQLLKVFPHRFE